jgi:bacillithiol synthase
MKNIFSLQEILSLLEGDPNLFSPNVVLRPICQDYLFPTIIYVAGPSEVSYFAQFKLLYEHFNIPMPVIYPRASITIVEENIQRIIRKFNLNFTDFFNDAELLKDRVVASLTDFKIDELFLNTSGTVTESITSLRDGLVKIDPTLVPAMENTLLKIQNSINVLREKTLSAQKRQHEISLRQLDKVTINLFPNSKPQEREINIIYFLNKYGLEFLRWLRGEIVIDKYMHQVINLE